MGKRKRITLSTKRKKGKRGKSEYRKKRDYLNSNGGWGFDIPHPKPWK